MIERIYELERLVLELRRRLFGLESRVTQDEQNTSKLWGLGGGGGTVGASNIYYIAPVVIAAGGNVSGQTVYQLVGGSPTTVTASATVYSVMAVATVSTAGKNIMVGPNGDGTYTAISQSC